MKTAAGSQGAAPFDVQKALRVFTRDGLTMAAMRQRFGCSDQSIRNHLWNFPEFQAELARRAAARKKGKDGTKWRGQ